MGDISLIDMYYALNIKTMYSSKMVALIRPLLYNAEYHNVHLLPSWNIKPYSQSLLLADQMHLIIQNLWVKIYIV